MTVGMAPLLRQLDARGVAQVRADSTWLSACAIDEMAGVGLLLPTPSRDVVCSGCEQHCVVVPERVSRVDGGMTHIHACIERDDVGFVRIDPMRMRAWRLGGVGLAGFLRRQLALSGAHEERIEGRLWELGEWRRAGARRTLYLGLGLRGDDAAARLADAHRCMDGIGPVLVVPDAVPGWEPPFPVLSVSRLLVDGIGPAIDIDLVAHHLGRGRPSSDAMVTPFPLPPQARWSNLVLDVVDGERLVIRYGPTTETRTFAEAGMGRRNGEDKGDRAWVCLCLFAAERGVITWQDDRAASWQLRDQVRELKERLLALFPGMEGDPFGKYTRGRGYEASFVVRARGA